MTHNSVSRVGHFGRRTMRVLPMIRELLVPAAEQSRGCAARVPTIDRMMRRWIPWCPRIEPALRHQGRDPPRPDEAILRGA